MILLMVMMNTNEFDPQMADVASRLEKLGQPRLSSAARQRIWQKACVQANVAATMAVPQPRHAPAFLRVLVSAMIAFGLLFAGTAWVAAQSLPGDALYPVARGLESVRLALTPAAQRTSLQLQFLDRRAAEIEALVQLDRPVPPELIAEIVAVVEQAANDPDAWGGEAAVALHIARQEEALGLVVARYPNYNAAARAFQAVSAARLRVRPGRLFEPGLPTPRPGDDGWMPPGQKDKEKTPPGQDDNAPPGQEGKDKVVPPGQGGTPPGQEDKDKTPPGQGGTPPGQEDKDKTPPGQGGTPPGQEDKENTPPGQGGTPPGQEDKENTPPGQGGTPPGQGGDPPPGQGGTPPGQGGDPPPGQGGTPPGQGGTPPGQGGDPPPGQGGTPPGQGGDPPPGQGGTPPGQQKKD